MYGWWEGLRDGTGVGGWMACKNCWLVVVLCCVGGWRGAWMDGVMTLVSLYVLIRSRLNMCATMLVSNCGFVS